MVGWGESEMSRRLGVTRRVLQQVELGEKLLGDDEDLCVSYQREFRRVGVMVRKRDLLEAQRRHPFIHERPRVARRFRFRGSVGFGVFPGGACYDDPRSRKKDWSIDPEGEP